MGFCIDPLQTLVHSQAFVVFFFLKLITTRDDSDEMKES